MHKIKSAICLALAIFLGGMFSTAAAQRKVPVPPLPVIGPLSGTYNATVAAVAVSLGDIDVNTGETYGMSWSGQTNGDLAGFIFVSLNYTTPSLSPFEASDTSVGGISKVTGGSWTKVIFMDGQYLGSISGAIKGGELNWNGKDGIVTVSLQLTCDQGTDSFEGSVGGGTFEGFWDQTRRGPAVTGQLTLNY